MIKATTWTCEACRSWQGGSSTGLSVLRPPTVNGLNAEGTAAGSSEIGVSAPRLEPVQRSSACHGRKTPISWRGGPLDSLDSIGTFCGSLLVIAEAS